MSKAIFLGSFNPPHKGHLDCIQSIVNSEIMNKLNIDTIHIIPCWQNPNKSKTIEFDYRYKMCNMLFSHLIDKKKVVIDDIERELKPEYTCTLLDYFNSNSDCYIKNDFWWIITEETLKELIDGKWKNSSHILEQNKFILLMEYDLPDPYIFKSNITNDRLELVSFNSNYNTHSTELREKVKNGESIEKYTNNNIQEYITKNNLYI